MAHFAEINEDNIVQRVIVVANEDTADEEGNEVEAIGAQFCTDLLGGTWVQTSYNDNFRLHYARAGMLYDQRETFSTSRSLTHLGHGMKRSISGKHLFLIQLLNRKKRF